MKTILDSLYINKLHVHIRTERFKRTRQIGTFETVLKSMHLVFPIRGCLVFCLAIPRPIVGGYRLYSIERPKELPKERLEAVRRCSVLN